MTTEWRSFLNDAAADANLPLQPGGHGFCALPDHGLLRISGEDAETFLQGQTTCDVKALAPGRIGWGALCTPKGRVIANFRLLRSNQDYYLLLPAELAEPVRKRLHRYVLRSKVLLDDLTPQRGLIGMFGSFESDLGVCGMEIPDEPGCGLEQPDYLALRLDDGSGRILIAATIDTARRVWSCLRERCPLAGSSTWRLQDIEAGLPEVVLATTEEFLPQMLNLDLLGGIGFQKGCYTGQEIVTRTHYLGQVKRRMLRLRCLDEAEPVPGTPIYDISDAEPKNVGQVVMAAPEAHARCQFLAVIGLDYAGSENLRIFRPDGPKVEFLTLPYFVEPAPGA
jgi:folate-binding protein YgfZ